MSQLEQMLNTHYAGINSGDLDTALSVFDPECEILTPNGTMRGAPAQRALVRGHDVDLAANRLCLVRLQPADPKIVVQARDDALENFLVGLPRRREVDGAREASQGRSRLPVPPRTGAGG